MCISLPDFQLCAGIFFRLELFALLQVRIFFALRKNAAFLHLRRKFRQMHISTVVDDIADALLVHGNEPLCHGRADGFAVNPAHLPPGQFRVFHSFAVLGKEHLRQYEIEQRRVFIKTDSLKKDVVICTFHISKDNLVGISL